MVGKTNKKQLTWLILVFFIVVASLFSKVPIQAKEESEGNEKIALLSSGNVGITINEFRIQTSQGYDLTNYAAMLHGDMINASIDWTATAQNSSFQAGDTVIFDFLVSDNINYLYSNTAYSDLVDSNGVTVGQWRINASTSGERTTGTIEMQFNASTSKTLSGTLVTGFNHKVNMPNATTSINGTVRIGDLYRNVLFCKNDYTTDQLLVTKSVINKTRDPNHPGWAGDTLEYTISATNLTGSDLKEILFFDELDMFKNFSPVLVEYYNEPDAEQKVDIYVDGIEVEQKDIVKTRGGLTQRYGSWSIPAGSTVQMKYRIKIKNIEDAANAAKGDGELSTGVLQGYQGNMTNTVTVGGVGAQANIDLQFPNLYVGKFVTDGDGGNNIAEPNDTITYTMVASNASNSGIATYEKMIIRDPLEGIYDYFVYPDDQVVTIKTQTVAGDESPSIVKNIEYSTVSELMSGNLMFDLESGHEIVITFSMVMKDETSLKALGFDNIDRFKNTVYAGINKADVDAYTKLNVDIAKKMTKVCDEVCDDDIVRPGDKVKFEFAIKNNLPIHVNEIPVQLLLGDTAQYFELDKKFYPDSRIYITSDKQGKPPSSWEPKDFPLIWNGGFKVWLDKGETQTVTVTLITKETLGTGNFDVSKLKNDFNGKLTNTVIVNNEFTATDSIAAGSPIISINKSVIDTNGDNYASPKEDLYYKILVRNETGATLADNTKVQDTLSNLLPYIEDPQNTIVTMKYTNKDNVVTTNETHKVSDLMSGMSIYLDIGEEVELTFKCTLKGKNEVPEGITLENTASANKLTSSVSITTSSKEYPATAYDDDINIWYLLIGIGGMMIATWMIYSIRKKVRYH